MKRQTCILILSLFVMWACSEKETPEEKGTGYLTVNIGAGTGLKADIHIEDFILRITDGDGKEEVRGRIGELQSQIALPAGNYTVEAHSVDFSDPKFDVPCYSGTTTAEIVAGETKEVSLVCTQSNAGIKVVWSNEFADLYQTYQAEARCGAGYLSYSATEARTGYFPAGTVSLKISADGKTLNGGTVALEARDLVTVTLRPKVSPTGGFSVTITVDETVNKHDVEFIIDPNDEYTETGNGSEANPYSVAQAIANQGGVDVWVIGYIVGSKPGTGWDFINGTWQATNIILADDASETANTKCIAVELGTGSFRTNLNLVDHPELLHRKIAIKGNLLAYQSISGLRNLTSFSIK